MNIFSGSFLPFLLLMVSASVFAFTFQLIYVLNCNRSVGSFNSDACKGKEWRGVLKEWLNLFKLMRNPRAFYRSQSLKDVLLIRLLQFWEITYHCTSFFLGY